MNKTNKGIVETILTHPLAFAFVAHSVLEIIEYAKTGKVAPFINVNIGGKSKEVDWGD